jgi:4-hydroxy-3-methylbut-2-enyl diphosphate reductase
VPAKHDLLVILAKPRGFCAGVERALETVAALLDRYGPPLYVHHQIVHNPHVVSELTRQGVIFVEGVQEVPVGVRLVISAHGASPVVFDETRKRMLHVIDATCPLVTKVHNEVASHSRHGHHVLLIGHGNHVETLGTAGHAHGDLTLIETQLDAERFAPEAGKTYATAMQTTLSLDDTDEIMRILRQRIPGLIEPARADICYATTNRQTAVKAIAARCDGMIVIGGANSSNSMRLVETARAAGCMRSWFVSRGVELDPRALAGLRTIGVSSGASTPESLVQELLDALERYYSVTYEEVSVAREDEHFRLPPIPGAPPTAVEL